MGSDEAEYTTFRIHDHSPHDRSTVYSASCGLCFCCEVRETVCSAAEHMTLRWGVTVAGGGVGDYPGFAGVCRLLRLWKKRHGGT